MPIQNGQLTDADEVMNAFGILFKNTAQTIFNADLAGFDAQFNLGNGIDKQNFDYRSGGTSTGTTAAGNMQYDSTNDFWWSYPTSEATFTSFDEHDDSTVNPALWSTSTSGGGSVTEDTSNMMVRANSSTGTATATSIDIFDNNNNVIISMPTFRAQGQGAGGGTDTGNVNFYIGTQQILNRVSTTNTISQYTNAKIQIIRFTTGSTFTYKYRIDTGSGYGSWNTSSETTDVQIKFEATLTSDGTGGDNFILVSYERFNTATDADGTVTTDAITHGSTITNAIGIIYGENASLSLSADNGSNYESVTDAEIHRFTNTGTQIKMRGTIAGTGRVANFAALYNLY